MSYEVQTPVFEGPFDLLLHLILKDQVDIYEVSLSNIVDAYLAELDRMIAEAKAAEAEGRHGPLSSCSSPQPSSNSKLADFCPPRAISISMKSLPSGKNATCCCRGCSSVRRSRTQPQPCAKWLSRLRGRIHAPLALTSVTTASRPIYSKGFRLTT